MFYYSIGVYCGNYRARTVKGEQPSASARGIHGSLKQAKSHAAALDAHYQDAHVMFIALPCDVAERRYSLSV